MSDDGALFDVPELSAAPAGPWKVGRVEAALHAAIEAGLADGTIVTVDAGLAAAALVAARGLDRAELGGIDKNGRHTGPQPYAIAALLTPYREALHALRLPAAIGPSPAALPAGGQTDTPSWLRDAFGSAE